MKQSQILICLSVLTFVACKPEPGPTPPTTTSDVETPAPESAESVPNCGDSYNVDAQIVDNGRGLDLQQLVGGTVITDAAPFECALPTSTSRAQFSFDAAVTHSDCPYTMSYVNDDTGETFSGSVALDCSTSELDYTATATPDTTSPKCAGASRLVDDPRIKLNTGNCGTEVD